MNRSIESGRVGGTTVPSNSLQVKCLDIEL